MSIARIEGTALTIVLGDRRIAVDFLEVEAAPEQPGTLLTGRTSDGDLATIYLDKDGEPCDEKTVRYVATKDEPEGSP